MRGEDGGHVEVARSAENQANARLPLVKLRHKERLRLLVLLQAAVDLLEEPGDQVAEDEGVV